MDKKEQGIHNIKWNAIGNWGNQLLSFITFAILARILNPDAFGLVAIASVYIVFVNIFVSQGLGMAIIQTRELQKTHLDTAFWINVISGTVCTSGTLLFAGPIATFMGDPRLDSVIATLSLCFLINALGNVQAAMLQRELMFAKMTRRQLVSQTAGGVTGIVMAFLGCGEWSLVGQTLVASLIGLIVNWTTSKWRPSFRFAKKALQDLWGYSLAVFAQNILSFIAKRSDQYFVGKLNGNIALGFYAIGQKIVTLMSMGLTAPISAVAVPMLAKTQDDGQKITKLVCQGIRILTFLCFPVYFGLACVAPDVVVLIFGNKWSQAGELVTFFTIGEAIYIIAIYNYPVFMAQNKKLFPIYLLIAKAIGMISAALIGILWGLRGVAIAVAINYVVTTIISMYLLHRVIPISLRQILSSIKSPVFCSAIMVAAVVSVNSLIAGNGSLVVRIVVCISIGIIVYIGAAYIVARNTLKEAKGYFSVMLKRR